MTGKRRHLSPISSPPSENGSGEVASRVPCDRATKDHDRFLPIANVNRIMKKSLPANAKISKEAKEKVQECVSEFISFITGEASDKCQREKRKTINGDDLLWAMTTLGFENYVEPLKVYLNKYREMEGEKTSSTTRQRDQSLTEESNSTTITYHGSNTTVNPTAKRPGFSGICSDVYPEKPTSLGVEGRIWGCGENLMDGFHVGRANGNGSGCVLRGADSVIQHHGVQWW